MTLRFQLLLRSSRASRPSPTFPGLTRTYAAPPRCAVGGAGHQHLSAKDRRDLTFRNVIEKVLESSILYLGITRRSGPIHRHLPDRPCCGFSPIRYRHSSHLEIGQDRCAAARSARAISRRCRSTARNRALHGPRRLSAGYGRFYHGRHLRRVFGPQEG